MKEQILHFHSALTGERKYDPNNPSIKEVETFLMYWLNGLDYDKKEEYIFEIYNAFKSNFVYEGKLYRGIAIDDGMELKNNYLTSFTNDLDVAKEFAIPYKEGQKSLVYYTESSVAFDLETFLFAVKEKTTNIDLDIVIEERVWEQEKLHIFKMEENNIVE